MHESLGGQARSGQDGGSQVCKRRTMHLVPRERVRGVRESAGRNKTLIIA